MAAADFLYFNNKIDLCLPPNNTTNSNLNPMSDENNIPESAKTPKIRFGSKEAYPHKNENFSPIQSYLDTAKSVHCVIRHGYRYPSTKDMENFRTLFPDYNKFRWLPSDGSQLTENGKKEQQRLGKL